jgi:RNA-directed DNA polymerase
VSKLSKLKSATSRIELAQLIGYKPASLTSIIYKTDPLQKYTTFTIDKKSGGTRTIKAPIHKLKKLQSHLSDLLYQCLETIEKGQAAKPISFGFRRDRSIVENAARHKRRRWVLNLDLEDFFPTFNFGRVRGYFLKDKAFQLNEEVATTIAQIACDGAALPQGSPCSPIISELIAQILDMALIRLAKKYKVTYTRYADDITFSTNQREFPAGLATFDIDKPHIWQLSDELIGKITKAGFTINNTKTRMHFRGSRQMVTGLVVNEKINVPCDYYRRSRSMCDSLFQTGKYYKSMLPLKNPGDVPEPDWKTKLNTLDGILSYIYYVTQCSETREISDQRQQPRAIRKLYRRFLFYKYCIALEAPLIITEGKTDPVYLRAAIRSRAEVYPQLGSQKDDKFEHKVKYYNYVGAAHEIMDLGGGSGDLKSIPLEYLRNLKQHKNAPKPFAFKPMSYPVIILLDNDDGLAAVASTVKQTFKVLIDLNSTSDFYHITDNLYLIKTPENGKTHTCIEDLFPREWRKKELNGKKLNTASKIDPSKEYSKEVFAKSVVKPNAAEIDFSGFDPLLERICKVIDDYAASP